MDCRASRSTQSRATRSGRPRPCAGTLLFRRRPLEPDSRDVEHFSTPRKYSEKLAVPSEILTDYSVPRVCRACGESANYFGTLEPGEGTLPWRRSIPSCRSEPYGVTFRDAGPRIRENEADVEFASASRESAFCGLRRPSVLDLDDDAVREPEIGVYRATRRYRSGFDGSYCNRSRASRRIPRLCARVWNGRGGERRWFFFQ